MKSVQIAGLSPTSLAAEFFRESVGQWKSQRRYYTLNQESEPVEAISSIRVEFLEQDSAELLHLGNLHGLPADVTLLCGTKVWWDSYYVKDNRRASKGSTIFGVSGDKIYRDRGFSTNKPVIASFVFTDPKTMILQTEYNDSLFQEELKLIGANHRTRQTIISKAGEQLMIAQYLETRMN
jgi:hypothetical protein